MFYLTKSSPVNLIFPISGHKLPQFIGLIRSSQNQGDCKHYKLQINSIESQPKKVVVIAVLDLGQVVAFGVVVVVVVVINVSPRNLPLKFGQNQVSNS